MVRYIHSGDQVEADKKNDKPALQKEPQQNPADEGRRQDTEASGTLGVNTRPVEGNEESRRSDLPEENGADGGENDNTGGGDLSAVTPEPGSSPADAGTPQGKEDDAASAGPDAAEGRAERGSAENAAADRTADDGGKDQGSADLTADGDAASEDGSAGDEGEHESGGIKGFLVSLFGDDAGPGQGTGEAEDQDQNAEAAEELGQNGEDSAAAVPGDKDNSGPDSSADIGVDSGVTGYGDYDLEDSNGAGTPDQEGIGKSGNEPMAKEEDPPVQDLNGDGEDKQAANSTNDQEGAAADSTEDEDNSAASAPDGQSQDTEAADELGAETEEKSHKGFFARLFGDDEESEDEEEDSSSPAVRQGETPKAQAEGGGTTGSEEAAAPPASAKTKSDKKAHAKQAADPGGKAKDLLQKKRDNEQSDSLEQSITYWQGDDKISPELEKNKKTLIEVLGLGSSFDVVFREMSFGGRRAALLCISGFAKDTIIDEILKRLTYLTPDNVSTDVFASFMSEYIPHVQVEKGELLSESINKVLSGMSVFFIEGETQVIIMDTRSYPSRNPDEPSIERVVRGARDGFTETLLSNVALVRRRIRDPGLKYEMHQIGRRTRTDVCVAYIDDIVDKTQVQAVTDKLKSVDIDGIPLADKQLEEAIVGGGWNPYPLVRYSERPDIVASHLLEGRVVIFVDTSPSVMVLPTTFFDLCQHAEENRQTPFMGSYLRWVRFIGIFASMFLLPLWMLLVIHPELKPPMLEFIGPQKTAKIPLIAQFLIVELGVDLLRMAAVHTPTPLGSAMGLIAAILVGDIAVQTGLFVNEVVLYMAVASIGMFATPSYELGLANRIVRLGLLLAVAAFQIPGFMIGTTLLVVLLTTHRSYNSSYMWPFIPFNAKAMGEIILRQPVLSSKTRPSFNKTRDNTRMPPVQEKEHKS